jgi:threonine dehydratase
VQECETTNAALVEEAAQRLAGVVTRTPLEPNARLSSRVDARVWLKREDLQTVRSYKVRGAYNFIVRLDEETRGRGVVCASAGNHAQGVAYACRRLSANGRVFVPGTTPRQKRERIATLGGSRIEVIVVGETYDLQTAFGVRHRAAKQHECGHGGPGLGLFDEVAGQGDQRGFHFVESCVESVGHHDGGGQVLGSNPVDADGLAALQLLGEQVQEKRAGP